MAELPAELQALRPLETPIALQSFSATQLMLFEESPARYFERYVLGLPETAERVFPPAGVDSVSDHGELDVADVGSDVGARSGRIQSLRSTE